MSRIRSTASVLVVSTALLFAFGCEAEPVAYAPSPAYPASGTYAETEAAPGPDPFAADADIVYDEPPPVDDIEAYPSIVYEGAPVYFIGGLWYRRDAHGWGAYRHEPGELARQRAQHERDPRWVQARQRAPQPANRAERVERRPPIENRPQSSLPQGVTERQATPAAPRPVPVPREVRPQPTRGAPVSMPTPRQEPGPRRGNVAGPSPAAAAPARAPRPGPPPPSTERR
jgi:hypothetical protein